MPPDQQDALLFELFDGISLLYGQLLFKRDQTVEAAAAAAAAAHCLDGRAEQDSVGHAFKAGYIIAGCSFLTNIGRLGPCRAPSCEALDIANVEEVLPWNLSRFQLCATKISPWTLQVANAYRLRAK
eukprot:scaffold149745_cov20-Tisochrysis_lutea.AAC.1